MKISKIGALLACAALAICAALPAKAASNIFNLTNIEAMANSETATVKNIEFADNTISGSINLEQLNDSVTLALTLENISDVAYRIGGVFDNLTENYLIANYDYDDGEIAPGDTTTLDVVLTYANEKAGASSFKIRDYTITISLLSDDDEAEVVINPGTGDNIVVFVVIMMATIIIAVVAIMLKKDKRIKALAVMLALSGVIALPNVINAEDVDTTEIKFVSITIGSKTISSVTTMQQMTHDVCAASEVNEKNTLIDTREGGVNSYIVGKAADNNCWMLQNLRLGSSVEVGGSITVDKTSTSTGEVSGSFVLSGKVDPSSSFDYYYNAGGYPTANDDSQFACNDDYGCYYNYTATTAGTALSDADSNTVVSDTICPKGWKLPTNNQQQRLLTLYSTNSDRLAAEGDTNNDAGAIPGLTVGGFYTRFGHVSVEFVGEYWSSTVAGINTIKTLTPRYDNSYANYTRDKYEGSSIRCIAL